MFKLSFRKLDFSSKTSIRKVWGKVITEMNLKKTPTWLSVIGCFPIKNNVVPRKAKTTRLKGAAITMYFLKENSTVFSLNASI